ncbi:GAF domain-containing sensor histidine kinase [Salinimicrobium soli]|uniref:GAF domain-containing sensor histidine kinase n=1 Tax=Salinimicrobium soli TaxID=1254399 RepID=UPI003AACAF8A
MMQQETVNGTPSEAVRKDILKKYEILDTPPDSSFDRITRLAALLLKVPVSIVTLVDSDRIWFKSKHGLDVTEVPRDPGLCASAIYSDGLYEVNDATKDARTLAHPMVTGDFGLRFYSAVPLKTREGVNLGTLCVIDKKPRELNNSEKEILKLLAELVMDQIELQLEAKTAMRHHHHILNTTAHDLKNPVSIMPLLADLIMENKDNPAAIDDISKQIKDAGRRMALTINEWLENAVETSGNMHLRLETFDFVELTEGIVNANRTLAKNKEQTITLDVGPKCMIFADHRKLTEVVDNLINNAIKYSEPGKEIDVFVGEIDGKAILQVSDQGQGLTKDDQKNLFRPYTSLSARPTGNEISTGLGLSLSREIILAHRGKISAYSEGKGEGATFIVELPLAEEA